MPEDKKEYGIEALKKVVDLGAEFHMALVSAKSDGKINVADTHLLMKPGIALFRVVPVLSSVVKEFKELDETEKGELISYAKTTYQLDDQAAERSIERGFGLAVQLADYIEDELSGDSV